MGELFNCGKTQISVILKTDKEKIKEFYEVNESGQLCQTGKRFCESKHSEVNDTLYIWYRLATSKNIYPDGSQLAEKPEK